MDRKLIGIIFSAMIFLSAFFAQAAPFRTTYQAKIIKPDGQPLQASAVNFRFTILDPAASCALYIEDYTAINMNDTGGLVAFALGAGVRSFPTSGTAATFSAVFDNSTPSFACQTPGVYLPSSIDSRKIVMQFNDGTGWQTLPAMSINAVPYSMYASKSENSIQLNGKSDTAFVEYSSLAALNCQSNEAIHFNGVSFSCIVAGGGSVTSGSVITALGYTPADGASVTALSSSLSSTNSTVSSVSSTVFSVSSTVSSLTGSVTSLQNSVAASFAAITSSQWSNTVSGISYLSGNVGIGTTTPVTRLDVAGGVRISMESATCAVSYAGTLRYNAGNVEYCNGTTWSAFGVSGAGLQSFNGSTSGTQSFANGTAGNAPAFVTANGIHTLNIPYASIGTTTAGLISNTDYQNFSNKITSSAAAIAQVLGYTPASATALGNYLVKSNNLSDLTDSSVARINLGLGTFATANTVDLGSASATGTLAIARLPSFSGDATIAAASNTIILANSGVTAGTYSKVTVDSKGRVTSGSQLLSGDVTTALGYTPAASGSFTSSQWNTSGTTINYTNGNVGIGTTTPTNTLSISGTANITGGLVIGDGTQNSAVARLDAANYAWYGWYLGGVRTAFIQSTATEYSIYSQKSGVPMTLYTSSTERVRLDANGNLGIGTTNPQRKLHLSNSGSAEFVIEDPAEAANSRIWRIQNYQSKFHFGAVDDAMTTDTKILTLQRDGNVGVGTTTPVTKLDVSGGVRISMESATCAASYAGTLRYNAGNVEFCNGTTWSAFGVSGAGLQSFNGSTSGTQSFANGTVGNAPAFVTANGVHTLNIPFASAGTTTAGLISNADYVNFNNKLSTLDLGGVSATGTLAIARMPAFTGDATIAAASNTIVLSNSGVATGTYSKVTVDSKGRVTSGSQLLSSDVTTALGYTPVASGSFTSSQWNTSGTTINYVAGDVGVGTASPRQKLDVFGIQESASGTTPRGSFVIGGASTAGVLNMGVHNPGTFYSWIQSRHESSASYFNLSLNPQGGNVGIGTTAPAAKLHLASGTTSVAPLKFTSGTLLTSPQSGTMEYDGFNFYVTDSTNTRRTIATGSSVGTIDNASNINSSGNITMTPVGSVVVSATTASTNSSTGALVVKGGLGVAGNIYTSGTIMTSSNIQGVSVTATSGMISPYIFGGTAASNNIVIDSTTSSTKGNILLAPNGGNIGVGTSSPGALLDLVSGSNQAIIKEQGAGSTAASFFYNVSDYTGISMNRNPETGVFTDTAKTHVGINLMSAVGNSYIAFSTASTNNTLAAERMRINSAGNVGIGTTSINTKLEIRDSAPTLRLQETTTGGDKRIEMGVTSSGTAWIGANQSAQDLTFQTVGTEKVRITSTGNVGVGTASPAYPLDIESANPAIRVGSPGLLGGALYLGNNNHGIARNYLSNGNDVGLFTTGGDIHLSANTSANSQLIIKNSGNVGVGTSAPTARLVVDSGTVNNIAIRDDSIENHKANGLGQVSINYAGYNGGVTQFRDLKIYNGKNSQIAHFDGTTGNVGIGTTNPTSKLSMNVSAAYDGIRIDSTSNGFLHSYVNAGAGSNNGITQAADKAIIYGGSTIDNAGGLVIAPWKSNTSGIRLDASGNVGIGTTSPSQKLEVNGGLRITGVGQIGPSGTYGYGLFQNGTSTFVGQMYGIASGIQFTDSAGANTITIKDGGNVGIGTTSPAAKLHVDGSIMVGTTSASFTTSVGVPANNPGGHNAAMVPTNISFGSGGANMTYKAVRNGANTFNDEYITFATHEGGVSIGERMRITPSGNVGIGTTAPAAKLEVRSSNAGALTAFTQSTANAGILINSDIVESTHNSGVFWKSSNDNPTKPKAGIWMYNENGPGSWLLFGTSNSYATGITNTAMAINPSGNVGIGTNFPVRSLHVNGDAYINAIVGGQNNGSGNFHLDAWSSGADRSVYLNWSSGTGGAKVGNGSSNWGPISASAFNTSSDRRLKENIKPIENPLDKILKLDAVTFTWKDATRHKMEGVRLGLIAQNVEKIFPQAVRIDRGENTLPGGTKLVTYPDLVAPLIAAIKEFYSLWWSDSKELHKTIENQNREIASVKEENAQIKSDNAKMKKENEEIKARLEKLEKALSK